MDVMSQSPKSTLRELTLSLLDGRIWRYRSDTTLPVPQELIDCLDWDRLGHEVNGYKALEKFTIRRTCQCYRHMDCDCPSTLEDVYIRAAQSQLRNLVAERKLYNSTIQGEQIYI